MLKGYDRSEAIALILSRMDPDDYKALPWSGMPDLLAQCIEADFRYNLCRGIMRKDGSDGERYYNRDSAYIFIAEALLKHNQLTEDQEFELSALIADYLDYNCSYLELHGLSYHVDERLQHD